MSRQAPLVAVVDDDESMREAISCLMRAVGLPVEAFASPTSFLNSANLDRVSCLVADVNMPEMSGFEMYCHLIASGRKIPTVLITAYGDETLRARALAAGVGCYLRKPFHEDDLLTCIHEALSESGGQS